MKPTLLQFSVVVLGQAHNPTILNPDFLAMRGIVREEWGWQLAETITTPPFSMVRYSNGVAIAVEQDKLQVTDTGPGDDPTTTRVAEVARRYVAALPHVRYTAVGINFQSIVQMGDAETYLKGRFVRPGPWDAEDRRLSAVGLRLAYPITGGRLLLSLDGGKVEHRVGEKQEALSGVLAGANFHRDCRTYPAEAEVLACLDKVDTDWKDYQVLAKVALEAEW